MGIKRVIVKMECLKCRSILKWRWGMTKQWCLECETFVNIKDTKIVEGEIHKIMG